MPHRNFPYLWLCALFALGGCSVGDWWQQSAPAACPDYAILRPAAELLGPAATANPERDWRIKIDRLAAECTAYGPRLEMRLAIRLLAARQNALIQPPPEQAYFIALVDADDNVINKDRAVAKFTFADTAPLQAVVIENAGLSFPDLGKNYRVLVGLELPDDAAEVP